MNKSKMLVRWLEMVFILFMFLNFAIMYMFYLNSNVIIPIHWSIIGIPDRWGNRATLFLGPIIGLITYVVLTYLITRIIKKLKKEYVANSNDENDNRVVFIEKSKFYFNLSKYFFVIIPYSLSYTSYIISKELYFPYLTILRVICILCTLLFVIKASQYIAECQQNKAISLKETIKRNFLYYNKNDKNIFVSRNYGGYTINFATKQGKMVFLLLVIVPLMIVLILLMSKV